MTEQTLTNQQLVELRAAGTITDQEVAFLEGDILLAKNVLTLERRIIGKAGDLLKESNQRTILKG